MLRASPKDGSHPFHVRAVRVSPFEYYVLKVYPEAGVDQFDFCVFNFTSRGKSTILTYDIYVELPAPTMSGTQFDQYVKDQTSRERLLLAELLENLKRLVETKHSPRD